MVLTTKALTGGVRGCKVRRGQHRSKGRGTTQTTRAPQDGQMVQQLLLLSGLMLAVQGISAMNLMMRARHAALGKQAYKERRHRAQGGNLGEIGRPLGMQVPQGLH